MAPALAEHSVSKRVRKPLPFPPKEPLPFPQPTPQTLPPAALLAGAFTDHYAPLLRRAHALLWANGWHGNWTRDIETEAEDIVSASFLAATQVLLAPDYDLQPDAPKTPRELRNWLFAVVRTRCMNGLRELHRARRRLGVQLSFTYEADTDGDGEGEQRHVAGPEIELPDTP